MKRFIFSCLVFAVFLQTQVLYAQQPLDEEIGFLFVKAEYLSETGRFDEAVTNYNKVISRDSLYKDVLLKRGYAKFALGAFKGAKLDALRYMDLKGISAESAALLGRSFEAMGQSEAAIQSITAAIGMASGNKDYYMWRAEMYENDDQISLACKDYDSSAKLGNTSAAIKVKALCGGFIQANTVQSNPTISTQELNPNPQTEQPESLDISQTDQPVQISVDTTQSTETFNQPQDENEVVHIEDSEPVQNLNIPQDDGTVNNIVIDDELNIEISGQELGKRAIKETPSILILSEENGKVTVNICVDKQGVVTRAEFNSSLSTIALKSLVNLALRKAKEFEFKPGKYDLQCGIMVFNIKGS